MTDKEKRIKEIEETLHKHDIAFEKLKEDLENIKHDYTEVLIKKHIQIIINNVIYLKQELEKLQK